MPDGSNGLLQNYIFPEPNDKSTWTMSIADYTNLSIPLFIGLTFQFYNTLPDGTDAGPGRTYLVPSTGIVPDRDVILLTYNEDMTVTGQVINSLTGAISSIPKGL